MVLPLVSILALRITSTHSIFRSHIEWHLEAYVVSRSIAKLWGLTISSSGLAVVFAEDIPKVAEANPVPRECSQTQPTSLKRTNVCSQRTGEICALSSQMRTPTMYEIVVDAFISHQWIVKRNIFALRLGIHSFQK